MSAVPDQAVPRDSSSSYGRGTDIRSRIIAAAEYLFEEHGYAATTMERIATEAAVARATVFNHFPHKELLMGEVIEPQYITFSEILKDDADPSLTLRERLTKAVNVWTVAFARDIGAALAITQAWVQAGGQALAGQDITADVLTEMIRSEIAAGNIRHIDDPVAAARAINDVLTGATVRWSITPDPTAESLRETVLAGTMAVRLD